MRNFHQKIFVVFVISLLALPLTRFLGIKDRSPLNIVEFTGEAPSLLKQSFKKRKFQKNFEDYWNLSFGQRRRAIVIQHVLYEIFNFGQFHAGYRKTLPEAYGGGLLEKIELDAMFNQSCPKKRELYKERLIAIKNNLAAKNVPFYFILAPSKTRTFLSESKDYEKNYRLPWYYKLFVKNKKVCETYDEWENMLEQAGISYYNGQKLFDDIVKSEKYYPYPLTGAHINQYGYARLLEEFFSKFKIADVSDIKTNLVKNYASPGDRDMSDLLFLPWMYKPEYLFPKTNMKISNFKKKKIFIAGDSNVERIFEYLQTTKNILDVNTVGRNMFISNNIDVAWNTTFSRENVSFFLSRADTVVLMYQERNLEPEYVDWLKINQIYENLPNMYSENLLRNEKGNVIITDKTKIYVSNQKKQKLKIIIHPEIKQNISVKCNSKEIARIDNMDINNIDMPIKCYNNINNTNITISNLNGKDVVLRFFDVTSKYDQKHEGF